MPARSFALFPPICRQCCSLVEHGSNTRGPLNTLQLHRARLAGRGPERALGLSATLWLTLACACVRRRSGAKQACCRAGLPGGSQQCCALGAGARARRGCAAAPFQTDVPATGHRCPHAAPPQPGRPPASLTPRAPGRLCARAAGPGGRGGGPPDPHARPGAERRRHGPARRAPRLRGPQPAAQPEPGEHPHADPRLPRLRLAVRVRCGLAARRPRRCTACASACSCMARMWRRGRSARAARRSSSALALHSLLKRITPPAPCLSAAYLASLRRCALACMLLWSPSTLLQGLRMGRPLRR